LVIRIATVNRQGFELVKKTNRMGQTPMKIIIEHNHKHFAIEASAVFRVALGWLQNSEAVKLPPSIIELLHRQLSVLDDIQHKL